MAISSKLFLVSFGAALVLSIGLSTASARNLSISNRNIRSTWASYESLSTTGEVRCPVTMEGSFHANTFDKIVDSLIGYITRATARSQSCSGGSLSVLPESLPWHIRYRDFAGTLPRIRGLHIGYIGQKMSINIGGVACSLQTSAANPAVLVMNVETATGEIDSIDADQNAEIPLRGGFFCGIAGSGNFAGRGLPRLLGTTARIFLRLI